MGRTLTRIAISLCCGAALALAYPRFGLGLCAWIAPVPWLALTVSRSPARAFGLGWTFGFGFFGLLLVWVHGVLSHYTTLPLILTLPIWILLVGYLALFPAVFGAIVAGLVRRLGISAVLFAPVLWVGLETARGFLLGGFPWGLAGYAHAGGLALWQAASVGGVSLVSLLIAGAWSALTLLWLAMRDRFLPRNRGGGAEGAANDGQIRNRKDTADSVRRARVPTTALLTAGGMLVAVVCAAAFGTARLRAHPPLLHVDDSDQGWIEARPASNLGTSSLGVALIQGGFGSDLDEEQARKALRDYLALSYKATRASPSLIVWPESNAPFLVEGSPDFLGILMDLSRRTKAHVLLGSVAGDGVSGLRNSAYLIGPEGVAARYDKRRLVQYGEYVPLKTIFPFIRKFVPEAGDFTPGSGVGIMRVDDHVLGVAICYEMIFPEEILLQVHTGAELLVNLTNDSWFPGAGPWQHAEFAQMRAIETGSWTVRAASTGRTVVIDPLGRVTAALPMGAPGVLVAHVPTTAPSNPTRPTLYVRRGAWGAGACVTITALVLAFLVVGNIIDRRRWARASRPLGRAPA